ncbi:hypothetical protein VNO80_19518 [Phaseolus coccineus]|uniref:Uncharacterized protein n=1 Tax=Phaseolus coccineus TaxID=3886 RepID=A0AAN9QZU8_PHACN
MGAVSGGSASSLGLRSGALVCWCSSGAGSLGLRSGALVCWCGGSAGSLVLRSGALVQRRLSGVVTAWVAREGKQPGFLAQPVCRVQISTMTVKENLMVASGFHDEFICKNLKQPGVLFCGKITTDDTTITNVVDVYRNPVGSLRVITANNDSQVWVFDAENFASFGCLNNDWFVKNISISPDGQILATGNKDTTCRLWDIRILSQSLAVLKGRMGAIRALRFTSDGRFLAMLSLQTSSIFFTLILVMYKLSTPYNNVDFRQANFQADMSPKYEDKLETSEDIWMMVSEIPLFTQPTTAPPPSRPPPPRPVHIPKSGSISSVSANARKKDNDFSSFPSST